MSGIDRLSGATPIGSTLPSASFGTREAAQQVIGEIGHRALAWVGASTPGGNGGSAAWTRAAGGSDFRPDAGELSRRGDIYGLRELASGISDRLGGTPTQEGELRRALEDFTRQAVVQVAGLAGASGERQVAGLGEALGQASSADSGHGVDGVVARVTAATQQLARQNG